mmetsp:Transcript_4190/g.9360  ORF Transcript_4190/g.9360 Transcript_4190/m.9360 type:complete len:288 (+) Transcript_4190:77-940(+)
MLQWSRRAIPRVHSRLACSSVRPRLVAGEEAKRRRTFFAKLQQMERGVLRVSPEEVDEEDDDDAADVDHGAAQAQRGNQLAEGLEDGLGDVPREVDHGVEQRRHVWEPGGQDAHQDRHVEDVQHRPEDARLQRHHGGGDARPGARLGPAQAEPAAELRRAGQRLALEEQPLQKRARPLAAPALAAPALELTARRPGRAHRAAPLRASLRLPLALAPRAPLGPRLAPAHAAGKRQRLGPPGPHAHAHFPACRVHSPKPETDSLSHSLKVDARHAFHFSLPPRLARTPP